MGADGPAAFQTSQEPARAPARVGTYANAAGAFVSLALLVGVGVWGYQLLVRDVSGVPVVRATQGPWRVAPENPGGQSADHQGLAVNEVAGKGSASGPVAQVALAPSPVGLEAEDVPGEALTLVAPLEMEDFEEELVLDASGDLALAMPEEDTPEDAAQPVSMSIMTNRVEDGAPRRPVGNASIQALADQIAADIEPMSAAAPAASAPVRTEVKPAEPEVAAAPAIEGPGVRRSLRPRTRPSDLVTVAARAPAQPAPSAAAVADAQEKDPATLPAGTRLVQLGAYESATIARQEWGRIAGKFDDFFDGKARVVQRAQSGGRTFYRLRAHGFEDLADARRFCAALVAEGPDCIPVVTK
ncbi:MAG: SPOR domain-containing protein [Rhodobacteraceae bacterium]|nr:MAG: SPOR domain-containing protein [Paracoccaceae bacterium]